MNIRRLLGLTVLLALFVGALLCFGLVLALSAVAIVDSSPPLNSDSVGRARAVLKQLNSMLESPQAQVEIRAQREDLEAIAALLHRTFPGIEARANPSRLQLLIAISAKLPANPFGRYLNLRLNVLPSSDGLELSHIEIGRFRLTGSGALFVGERLGNLLLGDSMGSRLRDSIRRVEMDESGVSIAFRPLPGLKASLRRLSHELAAAGEQFQPFVDLERARNYYRILCRTGTLLTGLGKVSMDQFTRPVFRAATLQSHDGRSAIDENRAALAALGIYLGNTRFQSVFGRVHDDSCPMMGPVVTLATRHDLGLHFVYSAMFQLLASSRISFSIGEYKELLDAASGGSGVSFTDLAADMAGIRLAESLLDPASAWSVQSRLAEKKEAEFFPEIVGLPDNLSQVAFEREFGGPEDARYRAVLREIENRINDLPLYRAIRG